MQELTFKIFTLTQLGELLKVDYNLNEISLHSPYVYTKQQLENRYNNSTRSSTKDEWSFNLLKEYDSKYFESYFDSLVKEDDSYARLGLYESYEPVSGKLFCELALIRLIYEKKLEFDNYIIAESIDQFGGIY